MFKYEIMTENKNLPGIVKIVSSHFQGFSIVKQLGYWGGQQEQSLNIVIVGNDRDQHAVRDIADRIKSLNDQQCVMILTSEVKQKMVD